MRNQLGESLNSVQKFDTSVEQATTPSLEALQAYSLGQRTMVVKDDFAAAIPFFQRAITIDPNFAMAYGLLGTSYSNLGETSLAAENTTKAYELRERVSAGEKLYLESHYYNNVIGDLEKARQAYELWAQMHPRDNGPPNNLAGIYGTLGQYDRALVEARETVRLAPYSGGAYATLVGVYLLLNRQEGARATVEEAQAKKLDSPYLRFSLYQLAFLRNDTAGMAQQAAWAAGKPGVEDVLLGGQANTAAYSGRGRGGPNSFAPCGGFRRAGAGKGDRSGLRSRSGAARSPLRQCSRSPATSRDGARHSKWSGCAVWGGASTGLDRGCGAGTVIGR